MNHRSLILAAIVSAAVSCTPKIDTAALDSLCSEVFPEDQPGAAVLVLKGDRVAFEKCYGIADMETGALITPETSFNIASISKQFTAVAVLQLCERGLVSLDDNIDKYFPEFTDDIWKDIRVKHILSHSSGIPDARKGYTLEQRIFGDDDRALEYLDTLTYLHFTPGTRYEYVNPTFVLAGRLVERVSGMDFAQYVRENIFIPAGMDRTCYFNPDALDAIPEMSHAYEKDSCGMWNEYDYGEDTFFATRPDGGIYTSVREFVKWEMALRDNKVLGAETLLDAQSPHTDTGKPRYDGDSVNTWYGYGWHVRPGTDDFEKVVYHPGGNGCFKLIAARYPESETLILIFANRSDWDRDELLKGIEALVL